MPGRGAPSPGIRGTPLKLYDSLTSGNCYKARLLLALLGIAYERIDVNTAEGETRTPEFLAMNPNGRVPVLETDQGGHLAESNAILVHLADGSRFLPDDPWLKAQVLQWLFFEQYSHEPYIAVVRHWIAELGLEDALRDKIAEKREGGYKALAVMEGQLAGNGFFVGGAYTVADIALYAYTHVAADGGFDLEPYGNVRAWLERVRGEPGHIPITEG